MIAQGTAVAPARETSLACWCRGGQWEVCSRGDTFGVLRCTRCGCCRIDPPPVSNPAELGHFYTSYYSDKVRSATSIDTPSDQETSRFWKVVHQFPPLAETLDSAVDVGCGNGTLCAELRSHGWKRVIGVDMSAGRIVEARRRHNGIEFYDVALEQAGIAPRSLDLAILDNVIEHVPDPFEQLTMVRETLKPGGRIVLITPNMTSGNFRLLRSRWTQELAPHVHIFLFTPNSLARLAIMAGFRVELTSTFHLDLYSMRDWMGRLASGDVRGAAWRGMQELGNLWARLIGSGPMVFIVAQKP